MNIPILPGPDDTWAIESAFQSAVCHLLKEAGVLHWDTSGLAGGRYGYSQTGAPDIMAIGRSGRFVGIELKTKVGKVSTHQRARGDQIEKAGGSYAVCRSIREVFEALQ